MAPRPDLPAEVTTRLGYAQALPAQTLTPAALPKQPGTYVIWEQSERLLYVGLAGVRWTVESPRPASTLARRLSDHLDARRADVLTSYVFERCIAPTLSSEQLGDMGAGTLSIRDLVREFLRSSTRIAWAITQDYPEARDIENAVRRGLLGQVPLINPLPSD